MTSPTIVSASSTTAASGTSITVSVPASITEGNLLLAAIHIASGSALGAVPSGWILLNTASNGTGLYWRIASSVEPANYTWIWTTASTSCGIIVQITGNSVYPIDISAASTNASSTNITAPTVTPRATTDLLVCFYMTNTANAITVPASQSNIGGVTGNSRAINCGYETLADTYATGTITSNNTNVSNNDTVTIGGKVYTFKTTLTPTEGEILIGATADDSLTNLSRAINNSGGTPGTDYKVAAESAWVTCSTVAAHVLTLTSIAPGTTGNSTTLAKSAVTLTVSGATLSGAKNGNGATGTRVATNSSATVNYGFSIGVKEPTILGALLPAGYTNLKGLIYTNEPNAAVVGDGIGAANIFKTGSHLYGQYKIEGYTKQITTGVPLARYAILLSKSGQLIYGQRTKVSETGFFSFQNLAAGTYTVVGLDENNVQNGVIAANVTAVAM